MRRIFGKAILLAAALMFSIAGTSCSSSGDNVNSLPENNGNNGNSGNNGNNGSSGRIQALPMKLLTTSRTSRLLQRVPM